jgi:hypothetical protein
MEDGTTIPVDTTQKNPNGEEFDNLYLDMNGIVHPCSHPEDRPAPKDEEEMMHEIFRYTDRVVNMVRPRKILMIAVGKSPCALGFCAMADVILSFLIKRRRCSPSQDEPTAIAPISLSTGSEGKGER